MGFDPATAAALAQVALPIVEDIFGLGNKGPSQQQLQQQQLLLAQQRAAQEAATRNQWLLVGGAVLVVGLFVALRR